MDDLDLAAEREQIDRDAAISNQRAKASVDVAPMICAGCDCFPQQRACIDFKHCLLDFDRRQAAGVRNGRAV
jgi:hypothetical protein